MPDDQNGAPDNKLIEQLEAIGFTHGGFTVGYTAVPRWRYLKDLTGITDEKSLLKSYDKRTQWSVKRAQSMGVHVRELSDDELGVFARIEQQTAERRSFEYRGEAYFHRFKEAFGSKAHFMVAEIHIDEYVADMTSKREALAKVAALTAKTPNTPPPKPNVSWGGDPQSGGSRKAPERGGRVRQRRGCTAGCGITIRGASARGHLPVLR